jgi:hypothetical protein
LQSGLNAVLGWFSGFFFFLKIFGDEKYPGVVEAQKEKLEAEGFTLLKKRKRYFVENYREFLLY